MSLEQIITEYGYWAIFLGTFLEGETILIIGGFFAHSGHLVLPFVILLAFAGTFLGDQLFFYLGRIRGMVVVERRPSWQAKATKVFRLLHNHQVPVIIGFRFLYGIRVVTPFILGASGIKPARFFLLNLLGAASWALSIGLLGYFLGQTIELLLEELKRYELLVFCLIIATGSLVWVSYLWRQHQKKKDVNSALREEKSERGN